jgi:hypothetical protein
MGINRDSRRTTTKDPYFALNAIKDADEENSGVYQSAPSNEFCVSLKEGYNIIGSIFLEDTDVVIFSTNGTLDEIGLLSDCVYTTIVNLNLNFSTDNIITGEYRVKNGCERIIYWNDGSNPDRFFNLDNTDQFKTNGVFDINKFSFAPDISPVCISIVSVNDTGGKLPYGSYWFQVEYLDVGFNTLYRSKPSPQTVIYGSTTSGNYDAIEGGYNIENFSYDFGGKPNTSKSITINLKDVDPTATYIKINVIREIVGDGITREAHSVGNLIPATNDVNFTYTGLNTNEGDTFEDVSSLLIDTSEYKTSRTMEQVQGRLVRGNVSEPYRDYSKTQRLASKVKVKYVTKDIEKKELNTGDSKNPKSYWYGSTFQSNEVYALGIKYKYPDGTKSPAFHIPGRTKTAADTGAINPELTNIPSCNELGVSGGNDLCVPESTSSDPELWQVESTAYRSGGSTVIGIATQYFYKFQIFNEHKAGDVYIDNDTFSRPENNESIQPPTNSNVWVNKINTHPAYQNLGSLSDVTASIQNISGIYYLIINSMNPLTVSSSFDVLDLVESGDNSTTTSITTDLGGCYATSGTLGYHQNCNATYVEPEIPCSDGFSYWGADTEGNPLEGTPIRHHRMPCRKTEPLHQDNTIRLIGVGYENVELPEGATGFEILVANRSNDQRTVVDSGIMHRNINCNNSNVVNAFMGARGGNTNKFTNNYTAFYGPKSLTNRAISGANYVKFNGIYRGTGGKESDFNGALTYSYIDNTFDNQGSEKEARDIILINHLTYFKDYVVSEQPSKTIDLEYHMSPTSTLNDGSTILTNLSLANPWHVVKLNNQLEEHSWDFADVQLMRVADIFSNLNSLTYYSAACDGDNISFDGGSFISPMPITNYLMYDFDNSKSAFNVVLTGLAFAAAAAVVILSAGALAPAATATVAALTTTAIVAASVGIAATAVEAIVSRQRTGDFDCALENVEPFGLAGPVDKGNTNKDSFGTFIEKKDRGWFYAGQHFDSMYVESPINFSLKHGSIDPCSSIVRNVDMRPLLDLTLNAGDRYALAKSMCATVASHIRNKVTYKNDEENIYFPKFPACPEVYIYNKDYNFKRMDLSIGLPFGFNYCSECITSAKNRLIYSPKSFDEELQDTFRVHYTNDYVDIPAHRGQINKIKYKNNNLLVHCDASTFVLKPNPQSIATSEESIYLSTGDFLGLPSTEMVQTDLGYGGLQHRLAAADSEYGYIWADSKAGTIFKYTNSIEELSKVGMGEWFTDNTFERGENYNTGVRIVYDPRFSRYIVSHLARTEFENQSYTLSTNSKEWVSFHSYLPNFIFNDGTYFYSATGNTINKHLHGKKYTNYDGVAYPFIIDYNSFSPETEDVHAIHYISTVEEYTPQNYKILRDKTFTEAIFYTEDETSGLQTLNYIDQHTNPYGNLDYSTSGVNVIKTNDIYKVSQIIDYSTNNPVMSELWDDKAATFSTYGYIDEVPINYNINKDQYQLKDLNGQVIRTRLIFTPENEERISIDILYTNKTKSKR